MVYLLDTSALLAHLFEEPGWEKVDGFLRDHPREVGISAMTWMEFHVRIHACAPNIEEAKEVLAIYDEVLGNAIPFSLEIAKAALELKLKASNQRLPNSDAIIAATAYVQGAILVHRDPHFGSIPSTMLRQVVLPSKQ